MNKNKKNNFALWGLILAVISTIAAVVSIPAIQSFLNSSSDVQQKEVSLVTQTESGEPLAGVQVQVIASEAPETIYTDSSGYTKTKIKSKGDVRIILIKSGYPTQDFIINLNDQNISKIIRLSKSGKPEVSSLPTVPAVILSPTLVQAEELTWNDNASKLSGKVDQDFSYFCPPNGTINNVWGTDFYTVGSSICSSAVHAGLINAKDGGKVQIRIRSGEEFYNGTIRNGVKSNPYGKYQGSFVFLDTAGSPKATKQIQQIEWNETASNLQGKLGQDFTYMCVEDGTFNNVWGTDVYTIGSSICSAAVHAGIINTRNGGKVQIRISPGEKFYNGTVRNGVQSNRYNNSYAWSFIFTK